ncbi:hypothetical protein C8039_13885 [Halogeometricum sp. wsp3]|nr:hypothetical protein C8039_13885 [Halogeometricum sp. wsp3]
MKSMRRHDDRRLVTTHCVAQTRTAARIRACEDGDGFAVVADEVRTLATASQAEADD